MVGGSTQSSNPFLLPLLEARHIAETYGSAQGAETTQMVIDWTLLINYWELQDSAFTTPLLLWAKEKVFSYMTNSFRTQLIFL